MGNLWCGHAEETSVENAILHTLNLNDLQEFSSQSANIDFLESVKKILNGNFEEIDFMEVLPSLKQRFLISFKEDISKMLLPMAAMLLMKLIFPTHASTRKTAFLICRISCIIVYISIYRRAVSLAQSLFEKIHQCCEILTPVMITATSLSGSETAAATLSPISALASNMIQTIFHRFSIAFSAGAVGIAIANGLSDKIQLNRLQKLIHSTANWGIGALMTFFMGTLTIQGRLSVGRDTVTSRTVRYAIESIIPIIGGDLSNSLDSLLSTAFVVKNAIGAAGLVVLLSVCILPLADLLCAVFIFKITAAIAEPAADCASTQLAAHFADATELLFTSALASMTLCGLLTGSCMFATAGILR